MENSILNDMTRTNLLFYFVRHSRRNERFHYDRISML